ncbi:hypothetical protein [Alkalihalobacillus sp. TS-13]|uniref:hypothetical protein n=1 Tax=Alkalihalobacillus sp. TS-13 TaxID=2842455 RepID=UPI001C889449|nr:hypothetical protein [Alkalihalobacillus sp. TS-13]
MDAKVDAEIPSEHIKGITDNSRRTTGLIPLMKVGDVAANIASKSSFLLQNIELQDGKMKLNGAGVIDGDKQKLVGFISEEEVQGNPYRVRSKIKQP